MKKIFDPNEIKVIDGISTSIIPCTFLSGFNMSGKLIFFIGKKS